MCGQYHNIISLKRAGSSREIGRYWHKNSGAPAGRSRFVDLGPSEKDK